MLVLSGALLLVTGCESRALRYSAFEDLTVGSYTIRLFTNGECEVEMGLGYHDGRYTIQKDTVCITYQEGRLSGMPTRLLLTPAYLITLPSLEYPQATRMHRQ